MKIYGLRMYPQSVKVIRGGGGPIFVHGRVDDDCSDFFHIFRPIAGLWKNRVFVDNFGIIHHEPGTPQGPMLDLREQFGASLFDGRLTLRRGDDFASWGSAVNFCEDAFLPIFRGPPSSEFVKLLNWTPEFRLTSETWPDRMRAALHMWDDIYWQMFTIVHSDIDALIRAHSGDPRLKVYFVEFDREYPEPSNEELRPATLPDRS